jgi:ATP-binding cassette subfamily B (MDR/TAP) protein 1
MFIIQLFSVLIFTMGTLVAGEAITDILREKYVRSLFKQNMAFFDNYGSGKIAQQITSNTGTVQDAISHKIGLFVSACSCFVTAYTIGFIKHWKLTFILTSTVVAISAVMAILAFFMGKYEERASSAIAEISGRVEEIFGGIRVVKSLGIETRLADGLEPHFQKVLNWSTKARHTLGWMLALIFGLIFLNYVSQS